MLKLLVVIICTACLPCISEQVPLTCESNEISLTDGPAQDLRVAKGLQRTRRDDPIFVGSNQSLTIIDEGNIISNSYVGVCYSTAGGGCYKIGNNVEECDNFLRGVTALGEDCNSGSCRVLACGTNAGLPRCSFCNYTDSVLNCSFTENIPAQDLPYDGTTNYQSCTASNINGEGVFQFEKNQNATFLYDSENSRLLYGVMRSSGNQESIIGLASIDSDGMISGPVITRTDSQKMVATEAHFVGTPFVRGDFAYFLFREPALEVASLSNGQANGINTYYSRIARICRDDDGTSVSSTQTLTSYLKQRLVCCIRQGDGECSVEFNEIQDFVVGEDNTTIHAIFTNGQNASPMSALCVFDLDMIDGNFSSGSFFGSDGGTTNDRWREYDDTPVNPRPGFSCSNPNMGDTNFQRDYNLVLGPAVQTNTDPFFTYLEGDRFSNLEMYVEDGHDIYIISSDRGCLYKVNMSSPENENKTDLGSPCEDPVVNDTIKDLELLPGNKYLITTSSSVYDISSCNGPEESEGDFLGSPNLGNITARPNSVFEFVIDTTETGSPNITCNGMPVTDDQQAYLVLKKESLDATDILMLWRILILDECVVTFGGTSLNYIIQPYSKYTTGELCQRQEEWEESNKAYAELNRDDTCGMATENKTGSFDTIILRDNNQIQNCADCAYYGCTENTCTP